MILATSLTVDHLKRLELWLTRAGRPCFLPIGDIDRWVAILARQGSGFAVIAEDGQVLGALMLWGGGEVYAIMGWRAGPRMVAITRLVRTMLDRYQSVTAGAVRMRMALGMEPFAEDWLRLLGFTYAEMPYISNERGTFMAFERKRAVQLEPTFIE